ncbi:MAG: hypothetical protein ACP5OA_04325 [Candidatus Woesearchaeota archaeon]
MKKILLILFILLSVNLVYASEDCPLGLINDTAPGSCVLYVDKNTDNLCDLSQPGLPDACDTNITAGDLDSTAIKSMTVKQVAEYYGINENNFAEKISELAGIKVKATDSFQVLHDNYGVRPVNVREVATALKNDVQVVIAEPEKTKSIYRSLTVAIITILLYLTTWLLSYKEKISKILHRKIWNWLLLITFIPVFLTSLFWLLRVDYGIIVSLPLNITFWHVEFGIVMILISIFHIIWHTQYYIKK